MRIARVGDVVTVLRDGKYIDTIDAKAPESELVRLMVGRSIENQYPRVAQQPGKTLLEVKDLTRAGAIDHVSFDVHAGEVVGLAGLVGAGRTEVLRAIFGADSYDSGSVVVDGVQLPKSSIDKTIASGVGLVPEDRRTQGLILEASVADNLGLATWCRLPSSDLQILRDKANVRTTPLENCVSAWRILIKLQALCPVATSRKLCSANGLWRT